tara:strand:+ start:94095 stop:94907 length:813 start_codon:yes stop_codon:yes gene_type:complete
MLKIGFITATYNRPELFERLHRSLAIQGDNAMWCHYVVDDGSRADYSDVFDSLQKLSGNLKTERISNSGVLIARNHAMEMAIADACTHLCFMDDDDILLPSSTGRMAECIRRYESRQWFVFPSKKEETPSTSWPDAPTEMSWFDDIILKQCLGSDNLTVIAASLIGNVRFTTRGRNQREWSFFLELCRKDDRVLVLPYVLREIQYQSDGLTSQTQNGRYKPEQISNSIERALKYWWLRPLSPKLFLQVIKQVGSAPLKLIIHNISHNQSR